MYGQPPVAALNQSAVTGANRAGTGACPYGGYDLVVQVAGENGKYDPAIHRRRSIRLQGYDYSHAGAYFVTLCTQDRECLFGDIVDGEMRLNDAGRIVANSWEWLAEQYDHVSLDEYVVMPNHAHGIIVITGDCRGGSRTAPTTGIRKPIGRLIGAFKTVSTKRINELRENGGTKLWQRNYWEHIVRNEPELNRIREYIHNNPARWELDSLNAGKGGSRTAPTEIRGPITEYGVEAWMV
jgi:REP element-mobilizing transposase RayT